jgi:ribonucleoside-diphosphate reductase alpha chain
LTPEVVEDYRTYGRRNIANTTTAPAGSVSCLTQTTSGIEPAFMLYYKSRKKVQNGEEVMFVDDLGDEWTEFNVYHHGLSSG